MDQDQVLFSDTHPLHFFSPREVHHPRVPGHAVAGGHITLGPIHSTQISAPGQFIMPVNSLADFYTGPPRD